MTVETLQPILNEFALGDDELRLALLLDYANKLPEIPDRLEAERDAGLNRVPECMTPVFLWVEPTDHETLRLFIDVAEEAPTVQGLMSIIVRAYDDQPAAAIADMPQDLLQQLQLDRAIRMQRAVGFSGIVGRIRKAAAAHLNGHAEENAP